MANKYHNKQIDNMPGAMSKPKKATAKKKGGKIMKGGKC